MFKKAFIASALAAGFAVVAHAALPEAFHNVPLRTLYDNLEDFRSRGIGPRSISVYSFGNDLYSMGVFDAASAGNVAKVNLGVTPDGTIEKMNREGYQLKELAVAMTHGRLLNFSFIFSKPTVPTFADYFMRQEQFDAAWQNYVVRQGYRVSNYITFSNKAENPSRRHGAVFVKDGRPFFFFHGLSQAEFEAKNREMGAKGFYPDDLFIGQTDEGELYNAVYLKPVGGLEWYYNMSAAEYQATFNQMAAKGFRLKKVVGYRNASRFAGIWVK